MTTIRFTLGDSDVWHEISLNYELTHQTFRDEQDLSYIIKREQEKCKDWCAKKVEVIDEHGNIIAETNNILEWDNLKYNDIQ